MRILISLFVLTFLVWAMPAHSATAQCNQDAINQAVALLNSPDAKGDPTGLKHLAQTAAIPEEYMHPEMMAVGDSLFNGITSLSIGPTLADHSIPALVARSLGLKSFRKADYKRFVLWNLESEFAETTSDLVVSLGPELRQNIQDWKNLYPNNGDRHQDALIDNLAIGGATSEELLCDTEQVYADWKKAPTGTSGLPKPIWSGDNFSDWFFAIDTSFVLNPTDDAKYSALSQMAQVMARKPKRLLINIGSNDGVWLAAFEGKTLTEQYPVNSSNPNGAKTSIQTQLDQLDSNMKLVASLIPTGTKTVYLDNLVPPSRSANLVPIDITQDCKTENGADRPHYYGTYQPFVSDAAIHPEACVDLQKMDAAICSYNKKIADDMQAILAKQHTVLVPINLNGMLWNYDYKDLQGAAAPRSFLDCTGNKIKDDSQTINVKWGEHQLALDNRPIYAGWEPGAGFNLIRGGLQGYDSMHPTLITYGQVADYVVDAISKTEHIQINPANLVTPQTVADELRKVPGPQALKMNFNVEFNLGAVHDFLTLIRLLKIQAETSHVELSALTAQNNAHVAGVTAAQMLSNHAACTLLPIFGVIGHHATTNSDVASTCNTVERTYNTVSH